MAELKPAEILKAVKACGVSSCTTDHHECPYGDDGCIDCVERLEEDFDALIASGDNLIIRRPAPENKDCADCSGIVYRQTSSGKIIPVDQRCGEKITPPCYHPDRDGCAYQIYGDNNDEPIDRCKACPLCYSDKVRHTAPENKALTLDELRQMDGDMETRPWVWVEVLALDNHHESAYYRVQSDFTRGRAFCCGWPGTGFAFDYSDYGKTWLAYRRKPAEEY